MGRPLRRVLMMCSVAMLGCGTSPLSPAESNQLIAAEARWAARGFTDYSVEVRIVCGQCAPYLRERIRVDVIDGAFHRAVLVATGEDISDRYEGDGTPVESQFARIRRANGDLDLGDLVVTFDERFGYPAYVASRHDPSVQDADEAVYLSKLQPLAGVAESK